MPGILDFRKGTENAGLELRPETWQGQLLPTRGPMYLSRSVHGWIYKLRCMQPIKR
jgi:hypothetical protein